PWFRLKKSRWIPKPPTLSKLECARLRKVGVFQAKRFVNLSPRGFPNSLHRTGLSRSGEYAAAVLAAASERYGAIRGGATKPHRLAPRLSAHGRRRSWQLGL